MNKKLLFLSIMFLFMVMLFATEDPIFIDSAQRLGDDGSYQVCLGDLDGDGDLDVFVGVSGDPTANRVLSKQPTALKAVAL